MFAKWRWHSLHSEHMVPGSFWKLRDEIAIYYLEDPIMIDLGLFDEFDFEFDKLYFLAKIEEQNGVYIVTFIDDTRCIETKIVKGCWDSVFVLVKGSTNPKPGNKLFLGRIPLKEVYAKIGE